MSIKQGKLYFFTRVYRKHPNSTCPVANRTVHGVGAWKSKGKSSYVTYANRKIGAKLLLRFNMGGVGPNAHRIPTNWVMEEYKSNPQSQAGATYLYDWVLCKVYQDGEAVAVPNNQANQAVELEHPIAVGDVGHYFGGTNNVDGDGPQQKHPHVQQNNNNDSNVRDGGTNELMTNRPCQLVTWKEISEEVVAEGTLLSVDPRQLVGGVTLGAFCWEVSVSRVVKNEEVYRYAPKSNFHSLEDAIGGTIAWPSSCIRQFPPCTLYDWTLEPGIAVGEAAVVCQDPSTIVNGWPLGFDC